MKRPRRTLMAILAHPDDETLGFGGTLARYAAEGVDVHLVTATRGDAGRFRGHRPGEPEHPGRRALAAVRETELRAAASTLGIGQVTLLDYQDQQLDRADARAAVATIAHHIRGARPDVVVTFGPDGAYGHPDHIAISQFAGAAVVAAADPAFASSDLSAHAVKKFYYLAWPQSSWSLYQAAVGELSSTVDGVRRVATPWPDWAVTTSIDARPWWRVVWRAVGCHESQLAGYSRLNSVPDDQHELLWGRQSFYRVFSTVNGGRGREDDLFQGID